MLSIEQCQVRSGNDSKQKSQYEPNCLECNTVARESSRREWLFMCVSRIKKWSFMTAHRRVKNDDRWTNKWGNRRDHIVEVHMKSFRNNAWEINRHHTSLPQTNYTLEIHMWRTSWKWPRVAVKLRNRYSFQPSSLFRFISWNQKELKKLHLMIHL